MFSQDSEPTFQDIQLSLTFPKFFQFTILILLIIIVIKKKKLSGQEEWYILTLALLKSFIYQAVYIFFDMILYNLAAVDFYAVSGDIYRFGYDLEYPSLFIASIMRDISILSVLFFSWEVIIASIIITKGELFAEEKFIKNYKLRVILIIFSLILAYFDVIGVTKIGDNILVSETWNSIGGIALLLIIAILFICSFMLSRTIHSMDHSNSEKKSYMLFNYGIFLFSLVSVYWMILGFLRAMVLSLSFMHFFLFIWIGHILWALSPVLIYSGLQEMWKQRR